MINKFNSRTLDLSLYGRIVRGALSICNSFDAVSFSFSHRSANHVAHCMAYWLMDGNAALDFGLDYPDFIHRLVLDETF